MVGNGRRPAVGRLTRVERNRMLLLLTPDADDEEEIAEDRPEVGSFEVDVEAVEEDEEAEVWAAALDPALPVRLGN